MSDAPVLVEKRDKHIAVVTLNRPDKLNALNAEVRRLLRDTFDALAEDDDVRAVVIHGTGEKAFVAGADVTEFAARTPDEQRAVYQERRIYHWHGELDRRLGTDNIPDELRVTPRLDEFVERV